MSLVNPSRQVALADEDPGHWGLARQSGELRQIAGRAWFLTKLPFLMVSMGPAHPRTKKAPELWAFRRHAVLRAKTPALYNCDPRLARAARDAGWHVRRTAMEATIRPAYWSTAGSKKQSLRRKLRQATSSGVAVIQATSVLPLSEMGPIAQHWATSHGGEMGVSMGRYCPNLIQEQLVFLIRRHDQLVGFVTFHHTSKDWVLDLIRHVDDIPDGAIHTAIVMAIDRARQQQVLTVSLASVPDPRYVPRRWADRKAGLIQFKRSFGPIWVARYHAAPTRPGFWISGLIIGIAIHRPLANLPWRIAACIKMIMQKYQLVGPGWRLKPR